MDPASLPFDQYQRYRLVADLIDGQRGDRALEILDVGGRTGLLRQFLPADRIVLVDLEVSGEPELVLGDGSALPFRSGSFDVVAAFDTLEHVPVERRAAFVSECARVSKSWVYLAGPYRALEVDEAEELLRAFLAQKLGMTHRFLEEHRREGLPDRGAVEEALRGAGMRVASIGHGNLERWLALMCMEMVLDSDALLRPIATRFFRFYNQTLYASDHAAPVYRHVVCGARGEAALPAATGLLDPASCPPGATRAIAAFAAEVCAFDREREVWRPELDRLKGIIADVEADLAGHRARVADLRAELEGAAQVEKELRETLTEAQHVNVQTVEHLRRTEAGATQIQQELLAAQKDIEHLLGACRERDEELASLRARLHDRWSNLRRALSWSKPAL